VYSQGGAGIESLRILEKANSGDTFGLIEANGVGEYDFEGGRYG
jgi:hypothetical protein